MDETTTISAIAAHLWASSTTEQQQTDINNDDDNKSDEISHFSRPLLTFAAVMTIIIMLVGIFGNLLTIVALIKCPKVRNVAAAFIISLCIADCIFCAIVLPFSAFRFIQGTWTHGELLCRLIPFIQYGNIGVSLLCIAMITINRYIMIAHHNAYARIYKRHWIGIMIAFCWLFSYGMQLPTFFKVWGAFGYDPKLGTCSILKDEYGRSSKTPLFVIAFVIPCIIIIGCYTRIFWVVHESEVRLRKHASKQNSIPNNLRPIPPTGATTNANPNNRNNVDDNNRIRSPVISSSSFSSGGGGGGGAAGTGTDNPGGGNSSSQKSMRIKDQRDVKARRNEWRITKMVLAIFLSFIMCYLPITLIKITDKDVKMPGFHVFGYIMLYLSSCINPIIYVIMNKQYRQAYKTVLMCKPSRLLPFKNAGSSIGEMERHRIQLQPQSYHGVANINCRPQQYQSAPASCNYGTYQQQYQQYYERQSPKLLRMGTWSQQQQQPQHHQQQQQINEDESSTIEGEYYPTKSKYYQYYYPQQQQQQHNQRLQQQQYHEFYGDQSFKPTTSLSPIGITASIYPNARFSTSRYSYNFGGGRRYSRRNGTHTRDDGGESSTTPSERHSR